MDKKDMLFTVCCILIVAAIMLFGVYGVVTREKNVVNVDKELETGVISETIEEINNINEYVIILSFIISPKI